MRHSPPHTPRDIMEIAASKGADLSYAALSEVYRFFQVRGEEAPGSYKAIHLTLLASENPGIKSPFANLDRDRLTSEIRR